MVLGWRVLRRSLNLKAVMDHVFLDYMHAEYVAFVVGYAVTVLVIVYIVIRAYYVASVVAAPPSPFLSVRGHVVGLDGDEKIGSSISSIRLTVARVFAMKLWEHVSYILTSMLVGTLTASYPHLSRLRAYFIPLLFRSRLSPEALYLLGLMVTYAVLAPLAFSLVLLVYYVVYSSVGVVTSSLVYSLANIVLAFLLVTSIVYVCMIILGRLESGMVSSFLAIFLISNYYSIEGPVGVALMALMLLVVVAMGFILARRRVVSV